jgi:hypothetical protein
VVLQPRDCRNNHGLGYSPFDRHYLGNHYCFLFLRVLRCFSSPGSPPDCSGYHAFNVMGCPIRKPADIMDICSSPQLIAACHVLLRLREPRHPPCALNYFLEYNLTNFSFYFSQYVKEPLRGFNPNPLIGGNVTPGGSWVNPIVENKGVEPLTPCVQGRCSGQLS